MKANNKNLLFITADQWRGDCLSAVDHPVVKTPHLDALARDGTLYLKHFSQAAPCGPSRASMHTGTYLMTNRSVNNGVPLDDRFTNWAKELRGAGHDPVLFGYTDISLDPRGRPLDDPALFTYQGVLPGLKLGMATDDEGVNWGRWLQGKGIEVPTPPRLLYRDKKPQTEWEHGGPSAAPMKLASEHHDTRFITQQAMDYIDAAESNWCVHLSLLRPHPPWVAPEPYNAMYDPGQLPANIGAKSITEESAQHPWLAYQLQQRVHMRPNNEKLMRRLSASYYGLMSEVDDNIGRLIALLKQSGEYDSTLIIFTSDHGEQLGDHWLLGKVGYFDQSFHVPLIVRDPLKEAGKTVNTFTENIDLMPTLLEWFGVDVPAQCDGLSLNAGVREECHWEFDFRNVNDSQAESALGITLHQCNLCVLRDDNFKYVHFAALPALLFDLRKDPHELVNCATDPAYSQRVTEYSQKMLSWRMRHADQTLTHLALGEDGVSQRQAPR